eukprot:scaffold23992_cov20-Prasinocladus_malaysianus.AAC.1
MFSLLFSWNNTNANANANTRQRQGKARQGKARQGKARQGKARQGVKPCKAIQDNSKRQKAGRRGGCIFTKVAKQFLKTWFGWHFKHTT